MATYLEGNATTYVARTPNTAGLTVTGDLDVRALVSPDSVAVEYFLVSKRDLGGREFSLLINAGAQPALEWRNASSADLFQAGNVGHGITAGTWGAVRATLDVDNGSGQHVVTFYSATSGVSETTDLSSVTWNQTSTHTLAGTTSIIDGAINHVQLGARGLDGGERQLDGKLAKAQIRNGINGSVVGSPDFTALSAGQTNATDAQGNVWTFGSGATIGGLAAAFARPISDASVGSWLTDTGASTNLFAAIDETTASDTDYIRSPTDPANAPVVVKLGSLVDPASSTGHIVRYRYLKSGTATIDLVVQLRQGYVSEGTPGTLIAAWSHTNISTTAATTAQTLSGAEADAITNYADLYLRFVANKTA